MPELVLQRRQEKAQYFVEALGDGIGLDMVLIQEGQFLMGSPAEEPERHSNEGPQHVVSVPRFFMGRYPITQAQWRVVAGMKQKNKDLTAAPSNFEGDDRPVENISWHDAVEFCDRLSQHTGRTYRLPSEAEWEYACRAGTTTPFSFGEILTTEVANYNGSYTYNNGPKEENRAETTPVGMFLANAWGLHDMHGNVLEWCQDVWHENYDKAPTDGSAWLKGGEQQARVLRGGSWDVGPRGCRSACRYGSNPVYRVSSFGFRVVCVAPRT